ncbi:MAG TPA: 30S ribosomal protein S2 [Candidatus Marinimicrobia bacterium]|jgi:small subunit ribosomal protein S2|nr:30S ribosomal protein S2 [Candidatus Neomarinimicrobiota bacterium]
MSEVNFENLLSTGAHFGHVTRKWHPSYEPFILMEKNGIHIINLEETLAGLKKAQDFLSGIVKKNGEVLFVGTKKQAKDIVQQEADRCGMFYVVERWLGGTLTNFSTIKKSIKRLQLLDKEGSKIYENLTKKEVQKLNRERVKLADQHRGIKDMRRVPDVVIIVDANYESTAVQEALRLEIPVIAIVDTNSDPTIVSHAIPANDDSIRTIQLIISALADTILSAQVKEVDKTEDNGEGEIVIETAVRVEAVDKEVEVAGNTAAVQEIGDESEGSGGEIIVEESTKDADKDLPNEVVVDEPQDDIEEPEEEHKSESN